MIKHRDQVERHMVHGAYRFENIFCLDLRGNDSIDNEDCSCVCCLMRYRSGHVSIANSRISKFMNRKYVNGKKIKDSW